MFSLQQETDVLYLQIFVDYNLTRPLLRKNTSYAL